MQNKIIFKIRKNSIFFALSLFMISNVSGAAVVQNNNPLSDNSIIYDVVEPSEVNLEAINTALQDEAVYNSILGNLVSSSASSEYTETIARRINNAREDFKRTGQKSKINFDLPEFDGVDWYFSLDEAGYAQIKFEIKSWIPVLQEMLQVSRTNPHQSRFDRGSELAMLAGELAQMSGYNINRINIMNITGINENLIYSAATRFVQELLLSEINFTNGVPTQFLSQQLNDLLLHTSDKFRDHNSRSRYFYLPSEASRRRDIWLQYLMNDTKLLKLLSMKNHERLLASNIIPKLTAHTYYLYETENDARYRPRNIGEYSPFIFSLELEENVDYWLSFGEDGHKTLIETFLGFCNQSRIKLTKEIKSMVNPPISIKNRIKYRVMFEFLDEIDELRSFIVILIKIFKVHVTIKDLVVMHQLKKEAMDIKEHVKHEFLNKVIDEKNKKLLDFLIPEISLDGTIGFTRLNRKFLPNATKGVFSRSEDGKLTNLVEDLPEQLPEERIKRLINFFPNKPNLNALIADFAIGEDFDSKIKFRRILFSIFHELRNIEI